jgi:hypothetical protein
MEIIRYLAVIVTSNLDILDVFLPLKRTIIIKETICVYNTKYAL